MARIHRLFRILLKAEGSDLHLAAGRAPMYRTHGEIEVIPGEPVLSDEELTSLLEELAPPAQWETFCQTNDLDFACELPGESRFRSNYFRQENGVGAVFRTIPDTVIPFDKLGIPDVVEGMADLRSGLVLVTGPTGSGKSTTLAAIIDLINERFAKHIVTIEDPVEFVHQNKKSVLSQREVGTDSRSFDAALRSAIRQDANVVLVGEMRDLETISLAIGAASMGVLVFGTLHTSGAAKTIDRIIDAFPADEQPQARNTLSESLTAVISQVLLRKVGGGRIGAHEILIRTSALPGVIREGKISMLNQIIASGSKEGMQTLDDTLLRYVKEGLITGEDAYMKASEKRRFEKWADAPSDE